MANKTFVAGDVFTAAEANTYFMNQVVVTCTAATRPTGIEGRVIYETDTDQILVYTGSAWLEIARHGARSTWTPTLNQSGTRSATVTKATYARQGREVTGYCSLAITQAGSAGFGIVVTQTGLPAMASGYGNVIGTFHYSDTGTAGYIGAVGYDGTTFTFTVHNAASALGGTPSFATANGDFFAFSFQYEST